jgi:hypothetical protein
VECIFKSTETLLPPLEQHIQQNCGDTGDVLKEIDFMSIQVLGTKGVGLAQKQVGPCIPVGRQLQKTEVGPTSVPTWRLSQSSHSQTPRVPRQPAA